MVMNYRKIGFLIGLILSISVFMLFCQTAEEKSSQTAKQMRPAQPKIIHRDLDEIKKRGKLFAITGYSATSYFIYKGQPMGYEYELLTRLAKHLGLELQIEIENNFDVIFDRLNRGDGDIIAYGLTVTRPRKKKVAFTDDLFTTNQVLVQRKPKNWRKMLPHQIEKKLIRDPIDLIGKKVYVKEASSYAMRLRNLSEEIGGDINIVEVGGEITTEELIKQVAEGKIDYTVSDAHIAMINQAYYESIDVDTPISLPQRIAWAVRKNSDSLLTAVNSWIRAMKKDDVFYVIHNKYFENRHAFNRRLKSDYLSLNSGRISKYDEIIQEQAKRIGWDWRLLASLIYEESRFKPGRTSWSGAVGLMQLLPETGKTFGAKNLHDPLQNIKAGVRFIKWLNDYWKDKIDDEAERLKFILASYNVGIGHVEDARRLAEKHGKDPDTWDKNVNYYLLKLSEPEYFNDGVVKFGYCRGIEPYDYVRDILEMYAQYSALITS
jgi:membrane-bound lytic murein transglycosylase F